VKIRYTLRAAAELERILVYVDERSPKGAQRVKQRLLETTTLLLQHPEAGALTSNRRLRRIVVYPYPYLIFYQATERELIIHGVRHSARDPASMPK
jgi:toxin ParE1/3/4